jgi:hypothetical protein
MHKNIPLHPLHTPRLLDSSTPPTSIPLSFSDPLWGESLSFSSSVPLVRLKTSASIPLSVLTTSTATVVHKLLDSIDTPYNYFVTPSCFVLCDLSSEPCVLLIRSLLPLPPPFPLTPRYPPCRPRLAPLSTSSPSGRGLSPAASPVAPL